MPASSPPISNTLRKILLNLGCQLRAHRKQLGISATAAAEAAGMSRMTLNRIERGESSVAMGAYLGLAFALGLSLEIVDLGVKNMKLPEKIKIADFKQLKKLAWQLKGTKEITAKEALELYERNWRHVDIKAMSSSESELLRMLLEAFGRKHLLV